MAHRGYRARFPENSLPALSAALEAGAWGVEVDIQLSADGCPVLLHDVSLRRTTGIDALVHDYYAANLERMPLLGGRSIHARPLQARLPTLEHAVTLLRHWPQAHTLVEIKGSAVRRFGTQRVLDAVLPRLERMRGPWTLIAFERPVLEAARARGAPRIGWILRAFDERTRRAAETLAPSLLVGRDSRLPQPWAPLWAGPWEWALYEINQPDTALALAELGVGIVETAEVERLLAHPAWASRSGVDAS